DILSHSLEAASGQRLGPGIDECDAPWFCVPLMHLHRVLVHVERDVRHVEEIVGEVLLDDVTAVAKADHELVDPEMRVDLHDVPKDRAAPDLDHGLWLEVGLLADAGSQSTSKNDYFHGVVPGRQESTKAARLGPRCPESTTSRLFRGVEAPTRIGSTAQIVPVGSGESSIASLGSRSSETNPPDIARWTDARPS